MKKAIFVLIALAVLLPASAQNTIYVCEVQGKKVLQDERCEAKGGVQTKKFSGPQPRDYSNSITDMGQKAGCDYLLGEKQRTYEDQYKRGIPVNVQVMNNLDKMIRERGCYVD